MHFAGSPLTSYKHTSDHELPTDWRQATYVLTGTAVAFIISELPGERAEALLYCKGSVGAHGGRSC